MKDLRPEHTDFVLQVFDAAQSRQTFETALTVPGGYDDDSLEVTGVDGVLVYLDSGQGDDKPWLGAFDTTYGHLRWSARGEAPILARATS